MESFCVNSLYAVSPQLTLSPRTKQKKPWRVRVSSMAATTGNSVKNGAVLKPLQSNSKSNNSALEQLDIERGVCIPFRKYSPQIVWFLAFLVAFCSLCFVFYLSNLPIALLEEIFIVFNDYHNSTSLLVLLLFLVFFFFKILFLKFLVQAVPVNLFGTWVGQLVS